MKPTLNPKLHDPDKAVDWFRGQVPVTDAEHDDLEAGAADRAFWISGIAEARMVTDVYDAIDKALDEGTTFEEFAEQVADKLFEAWGGESPWRLETVFRTNVQRAYNAGRWQEMQDPAVKEQRPYGRFDSVLDDRTTDICASLNGTVLPMDEWAGRVPPLHFGCRSTIVSVLAEDVEPEDVDSKHGLPPAAEGFGVTPDDSDDSAPDLTGLPEELVAELMSRQR